MNSGTRKRLGGVVRALLVLATAGLVVVWTTDSSGESNWWKRSASDRASLRAYDGAPPVIPHKRVGVDCATCHSRQGTQVPDLGFAPPSPHGQTAGLSEISRCEQCHVYRTTTEVWRATEFEPLQQDLRHGRRFLAFAPPVIPHKVFMRENCAACHTGPAAREEIRSSHPDRTRCRQCHLQQVTTQDFVRTGQP